MDYDAALVNFCPAEIVRDVRQMDLKSLQPRDILDEAVATGISLECYNAIAVWHTQKISPDVSSQALQNWLAGLLSYDGTLPDDVRLDVRSAILRLGDHREHSLLYFRVLRRHMIDIRAELADWIVPNWAFTTLPNRPEAHTWNYYVYLAALGDDDAYEALAQRAAREPSGNLALGLYDSLADLKTQQARVILETQRTDQRQVTSPGGRATPLGDLLGVKIDLGVWK